MKNREIFQRDPVAAKLLNDGVAAVTEATTDKEIATLRYELEHFVCEGQYHDGMVRILESFLGNADSAAQPAAWISGFYGSGKSHLLKVLRHLWVDTRFADGVTARGLALLPDDVRALLRELSTVGKRCGGLHAASGTLPSGGGGAVRPTVLGIVFRSKGLPESLSQTRFCLWLRKNGIYDTVEQHVLAAGRDFASELNDLGASPTIANAILSAFPTFAPSEDRVLDLLYEQFKPTPDVSTAEFVRLVREVLAVNGQLPATVILLDEVQQVLRENPERATEVQEVAEALCKQTDSRVLLVGAGQSALTATEALQKLLGRFTIPVELSDVDVETVTRRVVLAKKADKIKAIQDCLAAHVGEVDRQLAGSAIAARPDDRAVIVEDYPLLPVRRRFWEHALRAVDTAGTAAQLRTQLRVVHEAVRATADQPLGTVVPADFIFEQLQAGLVQTGSLLRVLDETIRKLDDGTADGRLASRLCGLVFLIRKLPPKPAVDIGVRATPEMLADLLVSDLSRDGASLRKEVPRVLDKLVQDGKLIRLDDGYSLQTPESSEWDREFRTRQARLSNDLAATGGKRASLLAAAFNDIVGAMRLLHGQSKEPRKLVLFFGDQPPTARGHEVPIWVRDGWGENEGTVVSDARAAGPDSPVAFVFVPKTAADALRGAIVDCEAARGTLDFKGAPVTDPAREARRGMEGRMRDAEARREEVIRQVVDGARVFQGGGSELFQPRLGEKVRAAAEAALDRLFPHFADADHERWGNVVKQAKEGAEDALRLVGWKDKPERHPVCSALLSTIGSGKKGKEIRAAFEDSPYGWPRDAVDAGLILLHATGHLRAVHNGALLAVGQLDQAKISVTEFRAELTTLDVNQKLQLRKLFLAVGVSCKPGEEVALADLFLTRLVERASQAGGDPPMPARPSTLHVESLRALAGTEQLAEILKLHDQLARQARDWGAASDLVTRRKPAWEVLQRLLAHSESLPETTELASQAAAVRGERRLLDSSDPVPAIHQTIVAVLRAAVNAAHGRYRAVFERERAALDGNDSWASLTTAQQQQLLAAEGVASAPAVEVGDDAALLRCLDDCSFDSWRTRTNALPQQFANLALAAAKLLEPETRSVHLTSATLRSASEVRAWVVKTEQELLAEVATGPIVVS